MQLNIFDLLLLTYWGIGRYQTIRHLRGFASDEFKQFYMGMGLLGDLGIIFVLKFCFEFVPTLLHPYFHLR